MKNARCNFLESSASFVQPTVQIPKILHLLSGMMTKTANPRIEQTGTLFQWLYIAEIKFVGGKHFDPNSMNISSLNFTILNNENKKQCCQSQGSLHHTLTRWIWSPPISGACGQVGAIRTPVA